MTRLADDPNRDRRPMKPAHGEVWTVHDNHRIGQTDYGLDKVRYGERACGRAWMEIVQQGLQDGASDKGI